MFFSRFFWFQKWQQKQIHATTCIQHFEISLYCVRSGSVPGWSVSPGRLGLLWLLIQLHVRHQDILLGLFCTVRVGAAVAGPFIRAPRSNSSVSVEVDHANNQHHKHQARYHNNNQRGQAVTIYWVEIEKERWKSG